jgi:hypothetical protein
MKIPTMPISPYFDRGFITYSNQAKVELLGVKKSTLDTYGAVSEQTALEMVLGYNNSFKVSATKATLLCTTCWRSPSKCFLMVAHSPEIQKPKHTVPLICITDPRERCF